MFIYIVIILAILILGIIIKPNDNKKNKKIYLIIIFTIITIVAAIRNVSVGIDTEQFCNAFKRIASISFEQALELRYEVGFICLCKIISYIWTNQQILIIVSSLLIFPIVGFFIYRNSEDVILSSLLYILLNTYAMQMNVMRQAIALAIIIVGYELFFKTDKMIKYMLLVVIASFFHQTALIMIFLVLLKDKKYNLKIYMLTTLAGIIAFLVANKIWNLAVSIFPSYAGYIDKGEYVSPSYLAGTISAIVAWLVLTMGMFFERKNKEKNGNYNFLAYMMSIIFIIDMIVIKINLFVRLASYFGIFTLIWLPNTLKNDLDKNERFLMYFLVVICFILYWGILSLYRPEWYGVIPYTTFFNQ